MKALLVGCLLSALLGCTTNVVDNTPCNVDRDYVTDLAEARALLIGRWKLTQEITMLANPGLPLPDLHVAFDRNGNVVTIRDGQRRETHTYRLVQQNGEIRLETNAGERADNWHLRNPAVRVCSSQLLLDGGIAFDAPGYKFERLPAERSE